MNSYSFEYENNFLLETFQESFLIVASKGLCAERLFYKHLQLYSDPSVLVLVLNATKADQKYFSQCLEDAGQPMPSMLTSETGVNERRSLYMQGGVHFVTTRILIADLLCDRVPVNLVTGILVYRAHSVLKTALESFILSTFRKKQSKAFVKAFSDAPQSFVEQFGQLQRAVTALGVKRVIFLPRYHVDVVKNLDSCGKPNLVELAVKLSPSMKTVQNCLTEMIGACVQELKRCQTANFPSDQNQEITLEFALLPWFVENLRRRLEQTVYVENFPLKIKRLLNDIGRLKEILNSLEIDDGKTFAKNFEAIRNDPREHQTNSGWLFTSACEKMLKTSKERLNEIPTKWDALKNVLEELKAEKIAQNLKLLIVAQEEVVCQRLIELISCRQPELAQNDANVESSEQNEETWLPDGSAVELNYDECTALAPCQPGAFAVYVIPLMQRYNILRCLDKFQPDYVILYNADIWAIRHLEIYNAVRTSDNFSVKSKPLRVFFLMYENSVEEQKYLTSLQQERSSFEKLFKEETNLLLRKEDFNENCGDWALDSKSDNGNLPLVQPTIIVDMREFRSELPTLLHTRGARLLPATLLVGDYVLSTQICVERKAPQDLVASLQSGRLLAQCQAMCRSYDRPVLLIEMTLGRKGWRRFDDRQSAAKLVILAAAFPRLRLLWATTPSSAAEIFLHLKFQRDEPDLEKAVSVGKEDDPNGALAQSQNFSYAPRRLLAALPEVTSKNVGRPLRNNVDRTGSIILCRNFREFCSLSENHYSEIFASSKIGARLKLFIEKDCKIQSYSKNKDDPAVKKQQIRVTRKRK